MYIFSKPKCEMDVNVRLWSLVVAGLFVTAGLGAQSASAQSSVRTMTFDEALQLMLDENPTLRALHFEEQAAHRARQSAIGLFMPRVNLRGGYLHMNKDIAIGFDGSLGSVLGFDLSYTLQRRNVAFLGGDVTLPLFTGGKILAANRAAAVEERLVGIAARRQRDALMTELARCYFGYSFAQAVVGVRRMVVAGVRRHLCDVQALERNGMASRSERLYVEYKLAEAERQAEDAELILRTTASALRTTLGVGEGDVLPLTPIFTLERLESLDHYRELALAHNALLGEVGAQRDLARQNLNAKRAEFMPEIVAMGSATLWEHQFSDMLPRWAVGVGVQLKLFDGLRREYAYSAARNTVRRVEMLQVKAEQEVPLLVESIYNRLVNMHNRIRAIEQAVAFADEYLRSCRVGFAEGVVTSTQVVDAELDLARVRVERMEAAFGFDVALAELLEAAGVAEDFPSYVRSGEAHAVNYNLQ